MSTKPKPPREIWVMLVDGEPRIANRDAESAERDRVAIGARLRCAVLATARYVLAAPVPKRKRKAGKR